MNSTPVLISPADLHSMMETQPVVVIDTRDGDAFAAGHLPGAVNLREIFTYLATSTAEGLRSIRSTFTAHCGAIGLSGVNQTAPIEASSSNAATGNAPNVSVTTLTGNAWVVDTVARFGAGTLTMTAATNRSEAWNTKITGKNQVGGAASYRGPISPPATVAMDWTWDANNHWAAAAVAVKPGGSGVINWREVVK